MSPSSFNWKQPAGQALEIALNRALALDPDSQAALRGLAGRRIVLHLDAPALALQVRVDGEALRVGPVDPGEPDLGVRATLAGLLRPLPVFRNSPGAPLGKLRIEGDAALAQRLQALARGFDPDWQRPFVAVFGELLGVQMAKAMAAALQQAKIAVRNLAETAAEFLTEEHRDVVPRAELEAFCDDVDALRDDVERIAAKVARLRRARGLAA